MIPTIAFLRAINAGGRYVAMERLRALFSELGLANVASFIASGNIIFETDEPPGRPLEERIEAHLRQALGYEVTTFLRTPADLVTIVARRPFPAAELDNPAHALYIAFLGRPPDDETRQALLALANPVDQLFLLGREIYWLACRSRGESLLSGAQLERAARQPATVRNANTVRRLAARYPA
jgi:uncharacterized protein (DUF1697 family)